jgi:hypothetical protein
MDDNCDNRLMEIYAQVNEIQRYEGEGIWSRFNILVSLNMVLFGAVTFVFTAKIDGGDTLTKLVSIFGCLLTLWAVYVLRRLWMWHAHWKSTLQEIESRFPANLPRPFSSRPRSLVKRSSWMQAWLLAYTQPFMWILFAIWVSLAVLSFSGRLKSNSATDPVPPSDGRHNCGGCSAEHVGACPCWSEAVIK